MIPLDDLVLRDDLDPRLGDRDSDLVAQYAEIFDALPPIEINQENEVIDGWHRVLAAQKAERSEIAYVVVETGGDDDLADRMWASNLRHGVQYSRGQRKSHGLKLHERGLKAKAIAERCGVSTSSVYSWTKALRKSSRQERDAKIERLRDEGKTQQEIADELEIGRSTVAEIVGDSKTGISDNEPANVTESAKEGDEEERVEEADAEAAPEGTVVEPSGESEPQADLVSTQTDMSDAPADEQVDSSGLEPDRDEASVDEEATTPEDEKESQPVPPEPIPTEILAAARRVMGAFRESRPEGYAARLEASSREWMTITDDSLANELERELLTSAAAMCLWGEQMIWYQGESASAFTGAFGKIGPVFVRGQAGQWRIVSKLRSMLRRLWA